MTTTSTRLGLIGLLAAGVFAAAPANAQQFTMKLSQPTINDVTHEYFKRVKAGIEQRAGGKIKVDIYPANQLGQLPAVVEGVALGTIEVGIGGQRVLGEPGAAFPGAGCARVVRRSVARQQNADRS